MEKHQMEHLDVNDLFDRPATIPRIPADAFEARLFRDHIVTTVERWAQHTYTASVGRQARHDGTWKLTISERRMDAASDAPVTIGHPDVAAWPRVEAGTIWIDDRDGRPVVAWAVADQQNDGDYAPANPWGQL